jgi:hypothetical protein
VCALATSALLRSPLTALAQTGADPSGDFQIPYEATTSPIFYFTRATFEPYVGGIFTAPGVGGRKVQLTLVSVRGYAPSAATRLTTKPQRRTDSFALLFRTTGQLRELTTTHNLEHAALGQFSLFMTESVVKGVRFYEAVFNRVVNT